ELSEEVMLGAVKFGHEQFQPVINAIIDFAEQCAKEPWALPAASENDDLKARVAEMTQDAYKAAYGIRAKQERSNKLNEIRSETVARLTEELGEGNFQSSAA